MFIRLIIISLLFFLSSKPLCQQYFGGSGNGINTNIKFSSVLGVAITDSLYNGGTGNGYTIKFSAAHFLGSLTADTLYNGGSSDGFSVMYSSSNFLGNGGLIDTLYNGGSGRGEKMINGTLDLSTCGIYKWSGSISTNWHEAINWECGAVPGIYSNVLIPSGLVRYPIVIVSTEIKSLLIQNGATVTIISLRNLKINGR